MNEEIKEVCIPVAGLTLEEKRELEAALVKAGFEWADGTTAISRRALKEACLIFVGNDGDSAHITYSAIEFGKSDRAVILFGFRNAIDRADEIHGSTAWKEKEERKEFDALKDEVATLKAKVSKKKKPAIQKP